MELETQAAFDPASFEHIPVLLNECLEGLAIDPAGTYLDGTAGGAGHSRQIALRLDAAMPDKLWKALASTRSTARCWIWAFPAISWTMRPAAFPTVRMHRWTCG